MRFLWTLNFTFWSGINNLKIYAMHRIIYILHGIPKKYFQTLRVRLCTFLWSFWIPKLHVKQMLLIWIIWHAKLTEQRPRGFFKEHKHLSLFFILALQASCFVLKAKCSIEWNWCNLWLRTADIGRQTMWCALISLKGHFDSLRHFLKKSQSEMIFQFWRMECRGCIT